MLSPRARMCPRSGGAERGLASTHYLRRHSAGKPSTCDGHVAIMPEGLTGLLRVRATMPNQAVPRTEFHSGTACLKSSLRRAGSVTLSPHTMQVKTACSGGAADALCSGEIGRETCRDNTRIQELT